MSPILVRPVREQLEHDRVIRLLQAKYKRKFDVGINPGTEQVAPAGSGASAAFPDLVLQSSGGRRLAGIVEVETGESVNNLEAMAQWVPYGRLRAAFYLYVPLGSIDVARRMCEDLGVPVAELWAYQQIGDQMRFSLMHRSPQSARARAAAAPARAGAAGGGRAAARKAPPRKAAKAPRKTAGAKAAPVRKTAAKPARAAKRPARAASTTRKK